MLEKMKDKVNANKALVHRGRWVTLAFILGIDNQDYLVAINGGKIKSVTPRQLATDAGQFNIRASQATWEEHWKSMPRRDYHDIWSMLPKNLIKIDGDLLPLMQNLQYFKDIIASLRSEKVTK